MFPKVYIILLNYKIWQDTVECLESLYRLDYPNYQVIVVDNPSQPTNESLTYIRQWAEGSLKIDFPKNTLSHLFSPCIQKPIPFEYLRQEDIEGKKIHTKSSNSLVLIQARENKGFAKGNNIALNYCLQKGDFEYLWILNNDTVVEKDSLRMLVEHYEAHKDTGLGILGGKVRYYQSPDTIQCIAGASYNKWLAYSRQIGNGQIDIGQFDHQNVKFDLVIGACMLVNRSFIEKVGFLGEDYFLYFEEQDWAERAKRQGLHLGYTHKAVIYHKEGSTVGGNQLTLGSINALSDFYYARSKIVFTKKFHSRLCLLTVYLSFIFIILNRIRRRQFDRISMLLKILFNPKMMYEDI